MKASDCSTIDMALMTEAPLPLSDDHLHEYLLLSDDEDFDVSSIFQEWEAEVSTSLEDDKKLLREFQHKVHPPPSPNSVVKFMGEFQIIGEFSAPLPLFPDLTTSDPRRRPFCTFLNFRGTRVYELKRKLSPSSSVPGMNNPPVKKRSRTL